MLLSLPSKLVFTMAKQIHKVILEVLVSAPTERIFRRILYLKLKQKLSYSFSFRHVLQLYMYTITSNT